MKVIIVTQDEILYIPEFMTRFFDRCREENIEIARVIILQPFNESAKKNALRMLRFYRPVLFMRQALRYAMRRLGDKLGLTCWSVARLADKYGISWCQVAKVNSADSVAAVQAANADVLLSVGATQIFKAPILNAPRWGAINVHTAKLPKYRGVMPTFWALYHGDANVGMTIFRMDEQIDVGQVLRQEELPITPHDTLDSVMRKTKRHEADMVITVLQEIDAGTVTMHEYEGEETYFTFPTPEEARELGRRGRKLL